MNVKMHAKCGQPSRLQLLTILFSGMRRFIQIPFMDFTVQMLLLKSG